MRAEPQVLERLVDSLRGLSRGEVRRLVRVAIHDDGALTAADLPQVNAAKFRLLDWGEAIHYSWETSDFAQVAGMEGLREWLELRREAFAGAQEEDAPRGILLLGVQGAGKSLAARAVAGCWRLPLLRLDVGALFNKYYGETERNLREALALAERMEPCVLWIDEIEKGFATGDADGGLAQRVLGTFLTWLQERRGRVFVVATANEIARLPAELLRKGRFDEIFFVDLPDAPTRREIFRIHLRERGLDPAAIDLESLVEATEGWSGAEIEQVVVGARYRAGGAPTTEDLLAEVFATAPLSRIMAERIAALRHWARERGLRSVRTPLRETPPRDSATPAIDPTSNPGEGPPSA